ncbi:MAG: dienelactone hydrolase family protein [Chloroflexota bacterium]
MCFEPGALPPIPPIAGGATDARDLTLTSADGTKFMAYAARAVQPTGAGIVVLPDVRGLHEYYKELALRYAEAGVDAVAIDYFARTAEDEDRGGEFDFMPHVRQTNIETVQADVAAAVAFMRSPEGGAVKSLFATGFCYGGALASLQSGSGLGYAGVIPFYGWPLGLPLGPILPRPIDHVSSFKSPILAIYGGGDAGIPPDAIKSFDDALAAAGVKHETHVYPNAPHSFFDRTQHEWKDACTDSWKQVLGFIKANSAG